MKRSRLTRHTPLRRRRRMRVINRKRRARLRAEAFGIQAELCRRTRCFACSSWPAEPHHEPPLKMGGVGADDSDTIPLCRKCHDRRHDEGLSALAVDPEAAKAEMRRRVLELAGEGPSHE